MMGMFDTVLIECKCGNVLKKQSKAGMCQLKEYAIDEVPVDIAISIDGEQLVCPNCKTDITISYPKTTPKFIEMKVEYKEWQGLTDDEIKSIYIFTTRYLKIGVIDFTDIVKLIEQKLKEKNK